MVENCQVGARVVCAVSKAGELAPCPSPSVLLPYGPRSSGGAGRMPSGMDL